MPNLPDILASLGLAGVIADAPFTSDGSGRFVDSAGAQVVFAGAEALQGWHRVIERERPGAWRVTMHACGQACGKRIATILDAKLAALGKPALATLPLEACLALLERAFTAHGWGRLQVDLTHAAEHGVVVAEIGQSFFVEALPEAEDFVDAMPAGILQGFFEYISGQELACEEIACGGRGAPHCTFVIAPADRLAAVKARIGRDPAEAILAQLTQPGS